MITPGIVSPGQQITAFSANIMASAIQNLSMMTRTTPEFIKSIPRPKYKASYVVASCCCQSKTDYHSFCDLKKLMALPFEIGYDVCYVANRYNCYPASEVYIAPRLKKGVILLDRYTLICVPTRAETGPDPVHSLYKGAPRYGYTHIYGGHVLLGWESSMCEWVSLGERQLINGDDYPDCKTSNTGTALLASVVWPRFIPVGERHPGSEGITAFVGVKRFIGENPTLEDFPTFPNYTELYDNNRPEEQVPLGAYYISVVKKKKCAYYCGRWQTYTELTVSDDGNGIKYWRGNIYGSFFTMPCEIHYESEKWLVCTNGTRVVRIFTCWNYHYCRGVTPTCASDGSQYFQLHVLQNTYIPPESLGKQYPPADFS